MKEIIIIVLLIFVFYLLVKRVSKIKNTSESKLTIYEHPSFFKKPEIEMMSEPNEKSEAPETNEPINFLDIQQDNERTQNFPQQENSNP